MANRNHAEPRYKGGYANAQGGATADTAYDKLNTKISSMWPPQDGWKELAECVLAYIAVARPEHPINRSCVKPLSAGNLNTRLAQVIDHMSLSQFLKLLQTFCPLFVGGELSANVAVEYHGGDNDEGHDHVTFHNDENFDGNAIALFDPDPSSERKSQIQLTVDNGGKRNTFTCKWPAIPRENVNKWLSDCIHRKLPYTQIISGFVQLFRTEKMPNNPVQQKAGAGKLIVDTLTQHGFFYDTEHQGPAVLRCSFTDRAYVK